MFKWHHEFSVEVDLSVSQLLDFASDLNNWSLWMDQFESFHIDKVDKKVTTIKGKIKNRNFYLPFIVTEIQPLKKYQLKVRSLFHTQASIATYQEISSSKSKYTVQTTIQSFLTPFMKSFYQKKVNTQFPKFLKAISDYKASLL